MLYYKISCPNPLTQLLQIDLRIEDIQTPELELQLAAWRPGRYELQNFAQNIQIFGVKGLYEKKAHWEKVSKDRWKVQVPPSRGLQISYRYYAHQMDAGGTWADETQLYVNPVTCLMAVVGREQEACTLELEVPTGWRVACGLKQPSPRTLVAENYDELVDCPLIASPTLKHHVFEATGTQFFIWMQGNVEPDWEKIEHDFRRYTEAQVAVFGSFPVPVYHYLYQLLPYKHYHGVEHSNSTVCVLGPDFAVFEEPMYKEFLGVSSHELFHTWNIKKIRPAEMQPYNFSRENYFRTGYIAEGVTTYYGDLMLGRSGVFTTEQYFDELNAQFKKYFDNYGRHYQSVAEASFDMWLDGYKPGIPNRKVSIYVNGAVAAFILDLELRKATANAQSLDTLMRRMWEEFGQGTGYTAADYQRLAEELGGVSFERYFRELIFGTVPYEFYLEQLLPYIGCELSIAPADTTVECVYGFRTQQKGEQLLVQLIAPGSPAEQALMLDDEIVAINSHKAEADLAKSIPAASEEPLVLEILRQKQLRHVTLQPSQQQFFQQYTIRKRDEATEEEKASFKAWLGVDF